MRKILLSILLILFIVLVCFLILGRISIGNFSILGLTDIKEKNQELDDKLKDLDKLVSMTYPQKRSMLDSTSRALTVAKTTYEEKVAYSTEQEVNLATKHEIYLIEFLWARVGNHATSEGVILEMKPTRSSTGATNSYDLNFTATGKYTGITDFIASLENDTKLEFIIENFKMLPSSKDADALTATFLVRDITINLNVEIFNQATLQNDESTQENISESENVSEESETKIEL